MLKFYLAVVADGMNLALILGALAAAYRRQQSQWRDRVLRRSLGAAFLLSSVNAWLRQVPHLVHRATLSFWSAFPLLLSGLLLLVFLFLFPCKKSPEKHRRFVGTALIFFIVTGSFYYIPRVLLYTTQLSYYGEVYTFTDMVLRVAGYLSGWALMFLAAFFVFRAASVLDEALLRIFLCPALLLFLIPVINDVILRLYQLRLIPKNPFIFRLLAMVTNGASVFIYLIMITLCGIPLFLFVLQKRLPQEYQNPAELRKLRARRRRMRRLAASVMAMFVLIFLSLSVIKALHEREVPLSPPEEYQFKDGHALIPLELLSDGHLHRFLYKSKEGYDVRFICLEKNPGNFAACFDACEICGASGYFERKDEIVCKLCDVVMNRGTIGFKGGCNPIPMVFTVDEPYLKISAEALETEAYRFR